MRLLVTRPEPDASEFTEHLAENGHDVYVEPMMEVRFDTDEPIDLDEVQALIATSRNGVRALVQSEALEIARLLPLFAVGPGTAAAARVAGITTVIAGPSGARQLAPFIVGRAEINGGALLHLAGERLAVDLAGELTALGFTVLQPTVYRTEHAAAFSADLVSCLETGEIEGVVLMSPQTARIFCRLLVAHGLTDLARSLAFFCLSDAVAHQLADIGAVHIHVASTPNIQEMLALIALSAAQSAGS